MPTIPTATLPRIVARGLPAGARPATIVARSGPVTLGTTDGYAVYMKRGVDVAETLAGLDEGYAVIIYSGVEVAESVIVLVVDGNAVIKNKGVEVVLAVSV